MLLLLAMACVPKPAAEPVTAAQTAVPAVAAATEPAAALAGAAEEGPPCGKLAPGLWPATRSEARVTVVIDGSFTPPDWLVFSSSVDSVAQAEVPGIRLCDVAALPGVIGVRGPWLGAPKAAP